jgi:arylsulfatase A-like enzyme
MADDHSKNAISSYGPSIISTPNIDRLSESGVRFENCLNVVSICAPSRAAILTGKYSVHNGFMRNGDIFNGEQPNFSSLLQKAGYETALFGKWHLRSEPTGYDQYKVMHNHGSYFDCKLKEKGHWTDGNKGEVHQGYLTDVITDLSIDWLKNRKTEKPFCLLVHHKAPHGEYEYPAVYDSVYADKDIPLPATFFDKYIGKNNNIQEDTCAFSKLQHMHPGHFVRPIPKNIKIGTPEYKNWSFQQVFKGYCRLVRALDINIGRLLDYMKENGLDENTIIVYTSDNGFFLGDHGMFNKMWMYEESLKVPLIVSYPKQFKQNYVVEELTSVLDFAPTFLHMADAPIPEGFQGNSLAPLLRGEKWEEREAHFYHYFGQFEVPEHYGVRTKKYKLIYFPDAKETSWEFYDLDNDPKEIHNLIDSSEYKDVIDSLKEVLHTEKNIAEGI